MTTTITVRLSERERRELKEHGKISEVVREALRAYLRSKNSARTITRLKDLQKTPIRTTIEGDLKLLRADRDR
jgi:Arc/MetJ-type ribon-helix-helix transcriptional regulator